MIRFTRGDILLSPLSFAIVVPVNVMGVAGTGLAKQVADRYPLWLDAYKILCRNKHLVGAGDVVITHTPQLERRWWINFATKRHWKEGAEPSSIEKGLQKMANGIRSKTYPQHIAIPALGCGLGGLRWDQIKPLIIKYLDGLDAEILVYESLCA